jgi:hypothetical protein
LAWDKMKPKQILYVMHGMGRETILRSNAMRHIYGCLSSTKGGRTVPLQASQYRLSHISSSRVTSSSLIYFYGMHPVVYLLDNIYLSIGQSTQQLLQ